MGKFIQISVKCRCCGQEYILNVTDDGYNDYMNGALVQDAFPCLSPEDRELLILHVDCFSDAMEILKSKKFN